MHGEGRSSRGGSGQWESRGAPGTAAPLSGGRRGVRRLVLMAAMAGDGGAGGVVDGGMTEATHLSSPSPEETGEGRKQNGGHTSCTYASTKLNRRERTSSAFQIKSKGKEEETTSCTCLVCQRAAAGDVADLDLLEMVGRSEPATS